MIGPIPTLLAVSTAGMFRERSSAVLRQRGPWYRLS